MLKKIILYHFCGGKEGGVHSVIKNLVNNTDNTRFDNQIIYLLRKEIINDITPNSNFKNFTINYSLFDNLYNTLNKIRKAIQSTSAILVCHDWLELACVSNLGLSNPVVFVLHGDYDFYYETATINQKFIDLFIVPSKNIKINLEKRIPNRKKDVFFQRFPVSNFQVTSADHSVLHCAFYVCDLSDQNKNFKLLPKIDAALVKKGIVVNWHIGGGGLKKNQIEEIWPNFDQSRIKIYGFLNNDKLLSLISSSNLFILPSYKEGMPISLIESMKSGLVPIVNNSSISLSEVIINGQNGFIVEENNLNSYIEIIETLKNNINYFKKLSENARNSTKAINEISTSVHAFEAIIYSICNTNKNRIPKKNYGSRLDNPYIPNLVTRSIRKVLHRYSW